MRKRTWRGRIYDWQRLSGTDVVFAVTLENAQDRTVEVTIKLHELRAIMARIDKVLNTPGGRHGGPI